MKLEQWSPNRRPLCMGKVFPFVSGALGICIYHHMPQQAVHPDLWVDLSAQSISLGSMSGISRSSTMEQTALLTIWCVGKVFSRSSLLAVVQRTLCQNKKGIMGLAPVSSLTLAFQCFVSVFNGRQCTCFHCIVWDQWHCDRGRAIPGDAHGVGVTHTRTKELKS